MDAGRELDALVAEKVMGFVAAHIDTDESVKRWHSDEWFAGDADLIAEIRQYRGAGIYSDHLLPHYSTDIAAAWQVVERMTATHRASVHHYPHVNNWWQCVLDIRDNKLRFPVERSHDGDEYANAPTAPHAICLAALKAVGVEL